MAKNFKKIVACLLAFAVIFTCIGSALATVSAEEETRAVSNGNGNATDVGIWYTTYNCDEFWAHRFAGKDTLPVGYDSLLPDGTYGVPFSGNIDIIDFHIQEMADAGIDFIMFDLTNGGLTEKVPYGWGQGSKGNCWNVQYAKLTAERLSLWNETHSWKIKYAVSVGTYGKLRNDDTIDFDNSDDISYTDAAEWQAEGVKEIFLNDAEIGDDYYCFDGDNDGVAEPLLVLFDWDNFGTQKITINSNTPNLADFTVRDAKRGEKGTYGWYNQNGATYDDEVVLVSPGHYNEGLSVSRRNGETYQNCWNTVLNSGDKTPRIVMISSFNDYMENTAVFATDTKRVNTAKGEEAWSNPYQYWDITVDSIAALQAKNKQLGFTVVTPSSGYDNVAKGAQVTGTQLGEYKLSNATDGVYNSDGTNTSNSAIVSYNSNGIAHYTVELGAKNTINSIAVKFANAAVDERPRDLAADVFVDGMWIRVAEIHAAADEDIWQTSKGNLNTVYFNFEAIECSAFRITANRAGTRDYYGTTYSYNFRVNEIEAYNNPTITEDDYTGVAAAIVEGTEIPQYRSNNMALGAQVTGTQLSNYKLSNATNGVYDKTASSESHSAVVSFGADHLATYTINLDSAATINNVKLRFYQSSRLNRPRDLAVFVKLESGIWERVAEFHPAGDQTIFPGNQDKTSKINTIDFYFEPVTAKAIKIVGNRMGTRIFNNEPNAGYDFRVNEIEAYNDPFVTDYTATTVIDESTETITHIGIDAVKVAGTEIPGILSDNVALNAQVTGAQLSTYKLSNATDGVYDKTASDTNSSAIVTFGSDNLATFTLELTSAATINNVKILYYYSSRLNRPCDLAVFVQLENGSWVRVSEIHPDNNRTLFPGNADKTSKTNTLDFYFEPVTAKAIKIIGNRAGIRIFNNEPTVSYDFRVNEIEAYNDPSVTDYTPTTIVNETSGVITHIGIDEVTVEGTEISVPISGNYALGQKVTSSNTNWVEYESTYPASRLTDGYASASDQAACAISNYVNGMASFTVNYDKAYTINKVVLGLSHHEYAKRPDEYAIEAYTADGWVRVATLKATVANATSTRIFYFEAVECTALRVIGNNKLNANNSPNFRLTEIETYFDPNLAESSYSGFGTTLDIAYLGNTQGDVDGNTWVNALDLTYALNWYIGATKRVESNSQIMDTNRDGKYDIRDYLYIVEVLANRDFTLMD